MSAIQNYKLTDIQEKVKDLPSLPTVVMRLSQLIADPMSSTQQVQDLMSQDQAITAKVLALANSAYYAIPGGVSTLQRAIAYLGFDTVHQLVLAASVFKALKVDKMSSFRFNDFWRHGMGVAVASEVIAKELHLHNPSEVFTCGLLHDMGKLAILKIDQDYLEQLCETAIRNKQTFYEAEQDAGILKHTKVGFILAEHWKLPRSIQNCILYHHERNMVARQKLGDEMNQYIDIVMIANLLIHALYFGDSGYKVVPPCPKEVLMRLGIKPENLAEIVMKFKEPLSKANGFLNVLKSD